MSDINFFFEDVPCLILPTNIIIEKVKIIARDMNKEAGEISIILCSDEYLLEMNKRYLKHFYFTDIITFNYNEDFLINGDLFISVHRVKSNAVKYRNSFIEELKRVIFHGILHLAGFDDETEEEVRIMREKEEFYLFGR